MNIEIKGIGLPNRGAELMLIGVMNEVSKAYPNAKFVLLPETPYEERAKHQTFQLMDFSIKGINLGRILSKLAPKTILHKFGIVRESDIDVIIDASGFAYSDQWGAQKAYLRLAKDIEKHKMAGKKVILMPQAFGPFTSPNIQKYMKTIIDNADLVFARDDQSFAYMKALDKNNKMKQSPDFSNLIQGKIPDWFSPTDKDVCFITNAKIIEKGGDEQAKNYVPFMTQLIELSQAKGMNPYLLLHEGKKDLALAEEINANLKTKVKILQTKDALEIKGIIGSAQVVVSSRFHGLVSALSQGVPVIATGWSHKYQMLLADYGCQEFIVDAYGEAGAEKLKQLFDRETHSQLSEQIKVASTKQKELSREMWSEVIETLKD